MTSIWKQPSTCVFFAIAFGVPWIGWTTTDVLASHGYKGALLTTLFYTGDFCTVAGFVATFVDQGGGGVKELLLRCIRWRTAVGWWLYAIFLPSFWAVTSMLALGLSHGGIGHVKPLQVFASMAPTRFLQAFSTGPLGEEAGWRGFLLPRMLQRYPPLKASLMLGVIWGVWHLPLYFQTMIAAPSLGFRFLLTTAAYSILITELFLNSRASVLLCMILHYTINVWPPVAQLMFPDIHPNSRGPAGWLSAGLICVVAIVVAIRLHFQASATVPA